MNHFNAVYRRPVLQSCMTSVPAESVLRPLKKEQEFRGSLRRVLMCGYVHCKKAEALVV